MVLKHWMQSAFEWTSEIGARRNLRNVEFELQVEDRMEHYERQAEFLGRSEEELRASAEADVKAAWSMQRWQTIKKVLFAVVPLAISIAAWWWLAPAAVAVGILGSLTFWAITGGGIAAALIGIPAYWRWESQIKEGVTNLVGIFSKIKMAVDESILEPWIAPIYEKWSHSRPVAFVARQGFKLKIAFARSAWAKGIAITAGLVVLGVVFGGVVSGLAAGLAPAAVAEIALPTFASVNIGGWSVNIGLGAVFSGLSVMVWLLRKGSDWYQFDRADGKLHVFGSARLGLGYYLRSLIPLIGYRLAVSYLRSKVMKHAESSKDRFWLQHLINLAPGNLPTDAEMREAHKALQRAESQKKLTTNRKTQKRMNRILQRSEEKLTTNKLKVKFDRYTKLREEIDKLREDLEEVGIPQNRQAALDAQLTAAEAELGDFVTRRLRSAADHAEFERLYTRNKAITAIFKAAKAGQEEEAYLDDFKAKDMATAFEQGMWNLYASRMARRDAKNQEDYRKRRDAIKKMKKSDRDKLLERNPVWTVVTRSDMDHLMNELGMPERFGNRAQSLSLAQRLNLINPEWGAGFDGWFDATDKNSPNYISAQEIGLPQGYEIIGSDQVTVEGQVAIGRALTHLKGIHAQDGNVSLDDFVDALRMYGVSIEDLNPELGNLVLLRPFVHATGENPTVTEALALLERKSEIMNGIVPGGVPPAEDGPVTMEDLQKLYYELIKGLDSESPVREEMMKALAEIEMRIAHQLVTGNRSLEKGQPGYAARDQVLEHLNKAEHLNPSMRHDIRDFRRKHGLGYKEEDLENYRKEHLEELERQIEDPNVPAHLRRILQAHRDMIVDMKIQVKPGMDSAAAVGDDGMATLAGAGQR